jgi:DHA2 family methylenomycin A resistance protein-like MFS transporter
MFLLSLDVTIINVALPTIQRALTVPTGALGWTAVAYTIPFATLMLSAGALSDRFGPAQVYLGGTVIFGIGSVIDAAAPNFSALLLGRIVQGIGASLCMPSALAVLRASVPPQKLGRAVALWAFSASVAISAGPIMTGVLVEYLTWRSIFGINIPIVLLAAYLIWPELRRPRPATPAHRKTVDASGQICYVVSSGSLIGGLILLGNRASGLHRDLAVGLLILSVCGLAAFFLAERRAVDPVLPASVRTNRMFQSAALVGVSISVVNFGLVYCLGLYYGGMHGFSALRSGLLFLPMMIACGVSTSIVERLRRAIGDRATVTAGLGAQLAGAALICVDPGRVGWVSANAAFIGFGVGLAIPPITAGLLAAVDADVTGVASGALSSVRQFGSALGVAVLAFMVRGAGTAVQVNLRQIGAVCAALMAVALATYLATSRVKARTDIVLEDFVK